MTTDTERLRSIEKMAEEYEQGAENRGEEINAANYRNIQTALANLRADLDDDGHRFEDCPDCGGRLEYPTQADVSCSDCDGLFTHEIRGDRHLLWRFSHEDGMEEVVARAE